VPQNIQIVSSLKVSITVNDIITKELGAETSEPEPTPSTYGFVFDDSSQALANYLVDVM